MPDPITLATLAVAFIAGGIASGGLEEVGKEIYHSIKGSFGSDELTVLGLLEKYPESDYIQKEVAVNLEQHLEKSPELFEKIELLLTKANQHLSLNSTNFNQQKGKININIQGNQNSPVNLDPKLPDEH